MVPEQEHDNVLIGQIVFEPQSSPGRFENPTDLQQAVQPGQHLLLRSAAGRHRHPRRDQTRFTSASSRKRRRKRCSVCSGRGRPADDDRAVRTPAVGRPAVGRHGVRARAGQLPESGAKPAETMRVDIERLDELMNLAGQLAIGKARVAQIGERLKKALTEKSLAQVRDGVGDLFETMHLLDRVSDGIQQSVMNMRMLPIGPLVQPVPSRDPRPYARQRKRHPPGHQRREHRTRQTDDRRVGRPDDPSDPQRRRPRHRIARRSRGRRQAPARHDLARAPSIAAAASSSAYPTTAAASMPTASAPRPSRKGSSRPPTPNA